MGKWGFSRRQAWKHAAQDRLENGKWPAATYRIPRETWGCLRECVACGPNLQSFGLAIGGPNGMQPGYEIRCLHCGHTRGSFAESPTRAILEWNEMYERTLQRGGPTGGRRLARLMERAMADYMEARRKRIERDEVDLRLMEELVKSGA